MTSSFNRPPNPRNFMKIPTPRVCSILALSLGLAACGGSDDDFQYPGATGSSLPYEVIGKVANA